MHFIVTAHFNGVKYEPKTYLYQENKMKKLIKRINTVNSLIRFAIDNDLTVSSYFGSSWPTLMTFRKEIKISPAGRVVTVQWLDGYEKDRLSNNKYKTSSEEDIEDLYYDLRYISAAIRNNPEYKARA